MHKLTFPILEALSDGQFHSGEQLAQRFDVSRATIFNALQSAEDAGVRIYSVRGKGYQLPHAITFLSLSALKAAGLSPTLLSMTEVHPVLDSTNQFLREQLTDNDQNRIVACNLQTAGRGRRGRQWQAQLGESLTFSIGWQFQCGAAELSGLSLSIGTALIRGLHALGFNQTALKWPNDIVVNTEEGYDKMAGILIELQGDLEGPSQAIIGIGLNLNLSRQTLQSIDQPVTDLSQLNDTNSVDPNIVLTGLLGALLPTLQNYEQNGFAVDKAFWLANNAFNSQPLRLLQSNGSEVTGTLHDISEDGALILQTEAGIQSFHAGEISLRTLSS